MMGNVSERSASQLRWLVIAAMGASALLAYRWTLPVGNLSVGRIALAALMASLIPFARHLHPGPRATRVLLAILVYVAACLVGLYYTDMFPVGARQLLQFLECIALFWGVYAASRLISQVRPDLLITIPFLAFLPSGLIGLMQAFQVVTGRTPTIPLIQFANLNELTSYAARVAFSGTARELGVQRIAAATGDPPTFGVLCAFVVTYDVWLRRTGRHRPLGAIPKLSVLSALVGLVVSSSISALIVLCVGCVATLWATRVQAQAGGAFATVRGAALLAIGCVPVLIWLATRIERVRIFWDVVVSRVANLLAGGGEESQHLTLLKGALQIFEENPILGVGTGSGTSVYLGEQTAFSSFHSVYALTAAELGLMGLVALGIFLTAWVRAYVPFGFAVALLASWGVYLDLDRMPYLWGLVAVVATINTADIALSLAPGRPGSGPLPLEHGRGRLGARGIRP